MSKSIINLYVKYSRIVWLYGYVHFWVFRMLIGYIRVSSEGDRQPTDLQRDALINAGVDPRNIFEDKVSGARDKPLGLQKALEYLNKED